MRPNILLLRKYFFSLTQAHFGDLSKSEYADVIGCYSYSGDSAVRGNLDLILQHSEHPPTDSVPWIMLRTGSLTFAPVVQIGQSTPSEPQNEQGNLFLSRTECRDFPVILDVHASKAGEALALAQSWLDSMLAISAAQVFRRAFGGSLRALQPTEITAPIFKADGAHYQVSVGMRCQLEYNLLVKVDAPILNRIIYLAKS